MAIPVHSRHAVAGVLAVVLIAGCGPGASPSPSSSPSQAASPPAASASPSAAESASPSGSASPTTVYVVRKGDTLIAIAKRFHITLAALRKANPHVTDPTKLRIGEKLAIPAP